MSQETTPQGASRLVSYESLRVIDVGHKIEKKNNLSYLSWAWAVDELLLRDPSANWEYRFGVDPATQQAVPYVCIGQTAMVFCTVHAFGVSRTAQLPVMDHRNKPIPNPDAFQVNTAMQRCLAKAIALHGLGLYIYAGEDVPEEVKPEKPEPKLTAEELKKAQDAIGDCETIEQLRDLYNGFDATTRTVTKELVAAVKKQLEAKAA